MEDSVDRILAQWAHVRPDVDVSPMGVLGRLSRLSRAVERRLQEVFTRHGLQPGEFDILATLRRTGAGARGITAGELAASSMVTSGAITHRLDRLVTKGMVTREVDPANRRTIRVSLTDRGMQAVDLALRDHVVNEEAILAALSGEDRAQLEALLRKMLFAAERDAQ